MAWCLQNEVEKPAWAPFLYSETKGSGKSTVCRLASKLFGEENSACLNNVDKLTARFNSTVLLSKRVVCEEVNLRPDSRQGNALKTFITEDTALAERKGIEAQSVKQRCCFLFTSNHLPLWIEAEDRRYYLIEIDHDGHATGPMALDFADLVRRLHEALESEAFVASLYQSLLERRLSNSFSAKTLNVVEDATELSVRVHGASELATMALMREYLAEKGCHAVPEQNVARIISEELKGNPNQAKHLMKNLGWSKLKVKWGGKDYGRAVWVDQKFWIDRGVLKGPNGYEQALSKHVEVPDELDLHSFPANESLEAKDDESVY